METDKNRNLKPTSVYQNKDWGQTYHFNLLKRVIDTPSPVSH